jgi:hypothetical protein
VEYMLEDIMKKAPMVRTGYLVITLNKNINV